MINAKFSKNDTILVIGCLTGYTLAIVSFLVGYVFGIDNDKKIIDEANKNINQLNILNCSVFLKKRFIQWFFEKCPI